LVILLRDALGEEVIIEIRKGNHSLDGSSGGVKHDSASAKLLEVAKGL
jgi:hypothetical protein